MEKTKLVGKNPEPVVAAVDKAELISVTSNQADAATEPVTGNQADAVTEQHHSICSAINRTDLPTEQKSSKRQKSVTFAYNLTNQQKDEKNMKSDPISAHQAETTTQRRDNSETTIQVVATVNQADSISQRSDRMNLTSEAVPVNKPELEQLLKVSRRRRITDEVKFHLKPYYYKKEIIKRDYMKILKKVVKKMTGLAYGEIDSYKIRALVIAYVNGYSKARYNRKIKRGDLIRERTHPCERTARPIHSYFDAGTNTEAKNAERRRKSEYLYAWLKSQNET